MAVLNLDRCKTGTGLMAAAVAGLAAAAARSGPARNSKEKHDERSDYVRSAGPSRPPDGCQLVRAGGYRLCRCLDHQRVGGGAESQRGRVRRPGGGRVVRGGGPALAMFAPPRALPRSPWLPW